MTDLLPCPFCGSHEIKKMKDGFTFCRNCNAFGPSSGRSFNKATWNTRAPDPALQEALEALLCVLEEITEMRETVDSCHDCWRLNNSKEQLQAHEERLQKARAVLAKHEGGKS